MDPRLVVGEDDELFLYQGAGDDVIRIALGVRRQAVVAALALLTPSTQPSFWRISDGRFHVGAKGLHASATAEYLRALEPSEMDRVKRFFGNDRGQIQLDLDSDTITIKFSGDYGEEPRTVEFSSASLFQDGFVDEILRTGRYKTTDGRLVIAHAGESNLPSAAEYYSVGMPGTHLCYILVGELLRCIGYLPPLSEG